MAIEHFGRRDLVRLIRVCQHALETREEQHALEKVEQMTKDKKNSRKKNYFYRPQFVIFLRWGDLT